MIVTRDRRHLRDRDRHIVAFLRDRGPQTVVEIAAGTGISLPHARALLARLRGDGEVKRTCRGTGRGRLPSIYEVAE